jgi:hypothetical protein
LIFDTQKPIQRMWWKIMTRIFHLSHLVDLVW